MKGYQIVKRSVLLPAIVSVCAVCFVAPPVHSADSKTRPKDEESIRQVVASFDAAVNKHDAHAFSMVFHENAEFMNVWGMRSRGRKLIEDFHRPLFEGDGAPGGPPSFKHAVFKVLDTHISFLCPDVASVDVTWSQTGSVLNGKPWEPRKGLLMWIVTKERGVWGISMMHNMELPLEPPKTW